MKLELDDVRLSRRNFSGREEEYNREGDRYITMRFTDPQLYDDMVAAGWVVKTGAPKPDDDGPVYYLKIKISFNPNYPRYDPIVWLKVGKDLHRIYEDTIHTMDDIEIERIDLDLRDGSWTRNGRSGVSVYLDKIRITQKIDRFQLENGGN